MKKILLLIIIVLLFFLLFYKKKEKEISGKGFVYYAFYDLYQYDFSNNKWNILLENIIVPDSSYAAMNGKYFAYYDFDHNDVMLIDLSNLQKKEIFSSNSLNNLSIASDGTKIGYSDFSQKYHIYDLETKKTTSFS